MRLFTARGLAVAALFPALISFSVVPGCSNQGEGDRCDSDEDCSTGLKCTASHLNDSTPRCCNPDRVTDARCTVGTGQVGTGGGAGTATAGDTSTAAGDTSTAGDTTAGGRSTGGNSGTGGSASLAGGTSMSMAGTGDGAEGGAGGSADSAPSAGAGG